MSYNFLWRPVERAMPQLLDAAVLTLEVSAISMVIGTSIGLAFALIRQWKIRPFNYMATVWIEVARNTPVLFQLYFFYFGLGAFGIFLGSYFAVIAGLAFNTAGYMAETFRGGLNAIPPTQERAALSLGMSRMQATQYIIVPQVMRVVWEPMTNQVIWVVLMSSLGMLVGLRELAGETQFLQSRTFRTFEFFAAAALIYYIICKILLAGFKLIGWKFFGLGAGAR